MRQIGTIAAEQEARRLADYLLTKGISVSIEPGAAGWNVWVRNEDHLDDARREFAEFSAAPDAAVYRDAGRTAEQVRAEEQRRAREAKKNFVNVGQKWRAGMVRRCPVTSLLVAASVVVALLSQLGGKHSVVALLSIVPYEIVDAQHIRYIPLHLIWYREPWRLVTPIFLHFNVMHILFNMLMLVQIGQLIEAVRGSWRFALLVLVIAIPSNFAQYYWSSPTFGGMSGVVYGLFGYLWMKSRYEPTAGFYVPQNAVIWMIGWFLLCLFEIIPNVANIVHGVGLGVGVVLGRWPSLWRQLR